MKIDLDKINQVSKALKGLTGCFLIGKIEGIDFTKSGKLENGTSYGSSVKLKFNQKVSTFKDVDGVAIPTTKLNSQIIKIPVEDSKLIEFITKYNNLLDKEVIINLDLNDNSTFKTTEVYELV